MSGRAALVHGPALEEYGFGEDHPFHPRRLRLTLSLCEELGLLKGYEFLEPEPATEEELRLVHSVGYLRAVQRASGGEYNARELLDYGLGTGDNPVVEGMHNAAASVVGGTLGAARAVMEGEVTHALCLAGGLHHALRSKASGFCIYNDAAVAIEVLRREYPGLRVAYIDTDVHHGDGVQWVFYGDPDVLTISTHESGRYLFPGSGGVEEMGSGEGKGCSVNLPLVPYTGDESWLECVEELLGRALEAFRPDLVISQNGCDGHTLDPLADLSATLRAYERIPALVHDLAHEHCEGRWVALGGGGYDHFRVVPRAWTLLWAAVSHQSVPATVPSAWVSRWRGHSALGLPVSMVDDPQDYPWLARERCDEQANRAALRRLLDGVLPLMC